MPRSLFRTTANAKSESTRVVRAIRSRRSQISENAPACWGFNFFLDKQLGERNDFLFGGDVYRDKINAPAFTTDPVTRVVTLSRPRVPHGARYLSYGFFVQDVFTAIPERLRISGALRYSVASYKSKRAVNAPIVGGQSAVPGRQRALRSFFRPGRRGCNSRRRVSISRQVRSRLSRSEHDRPRNSRTGRERDSKSMPAPPPRAGASSARRPVRMQCQRGFRSRDWYLKQPTALISAFGSGTGAAALRWPDSRANSTMSISIRRWSCRRARSATFSAANKSLRKMPMAWCLSPWPPGPCWFASTLTTRASTASSSTPRRG